MRNANLALSFLLELCLLAALGYWGFQTGQGLVMQIVLGIGAPLLVAVLWGAFMSPRAPIRLTVLFHLIVQMLLFALAVAALFAAGQPLLGWVLAVAFLVNQVLVLVWKQ
jgi:hypothetical protein